MTLKKFSPKHLVLQGFLELSESPIYFPIASGRFLSIPDEIAAEYERNMIGISIGIFFPWIRVYESPQKVISWNHHLKSAQKTILFLKFSRGPLENFWHEWTIRLLWQRNTTPNYKQGVRNVLEAFQTSCEAVWMSTQRESTRIIAKSVHEKTDSATKIHDFLLQKMGCSPPAKMRWNLCRISLAPARMP